ncbi:hypothetical protein [Alterisphingorhabdus coralli]|uniref:Uncharacterized protein n=1 Tax=Alterisphingorhabdus coralli TaxID=3071408 RepID=A0AA97F5I1_9SPHN|nr:hypothetical protein [Parasphingorhabdus sp. SCSIO 66989]WOE73806.1 hypothetical protein RB602_07965 [Parasphingorhabdus sp. SCSIO 66989]
MVEAKFILLMFIWFPSPVPKSLPIWTSEPHISLNACEKAAREMTARIKQQNGRDVRVEHQCVNKDDFTPPNDPLLQ